MSFVTTYYDALVTRLDTIFPAGSGWSRLPNPYQVEENNDIFMRQSYGLAIGNARNVQAINCNQIVARSIRVVICRECMFTDSDVANISATEKQLLEDVNTLMTDFEKAQFLTDGAGFAGYDGDSGIKDARDEEGKPAFIYIEVDFTMRLVQAL